jgi:F0F1-type ATP synthase beta subunit
MAQDSSGTILAILGDVIEVSFPDQKPNRHELLTLAEDPTVQLEVYSTAISDSVYCLSFSDPTKLYRGAKASDSGKSR